MISAQWPITSAVASRISKIVIKTITVFFNLFISRSNIFVANDEKKEKDEWESMNTSQLEFEI